MNLYGNNPKKFFIQKTKTIKAVFSEGNYVPKPQIESASMLTALYWVTMIQAEIHLLFKGEHAKTPVWSNFKLAKCCGYLVNKVKVIKI